MPTGSFPSQESEVSVGVEAADGTRDALQPRADHNDDSAPAFRVDDPRTDAVGIDLAGKRLHFVGIGGCGMSG